MWTQIHPIHTLSALTDLCGHHYLKESLCPVDACLNWAKGTLNNSVTVFGGSLRSCWWFSVGHVVLTAGKAEIRDGLVGTEGGGHLESGKSQFSRKLHPPSSSRRRDGYSNPDVYILCAVCIYVR